MVNLSIITVQAVLTTCDALGSIHSWHADIAHGVVYEVVRRCRRPMMHLCSRWQVARGIRSCRGVRHSPAGHHWWQQRANDVTTNWRYRVDVLQRQSGKIYIHTFTWSSTPTHNSTVPAYVQSLKSANFASSRHPWTMTITLDSDILTHHRVSFINHLNNKCHSNRWNFLRTDGRIYEQTSRLDSSEST